MSIKQVLNTISKSDEKLSEAIGISSKTIKRLKNTDHKCSKNTGLRILEYFEKIAYIINDFITTSRR